MPPPPLLYCASNSNDQEFEKYIGRARHLARSSNLKNHRHGCVIVDHVSGQIVAEGYNYTRQTLGNPSLNSMHAEMQAVAMYRPLRKLYPNCSMFVVRIGSDASGNPLKYSKPCRMCTECIQNAGIKRVYYSAHRCPDASGSGSDDAASSVQSCSSATGTGSGGYECESI